MRRAPSWKSSMCRTLHGIEFLIRSCLARRGQAGGAERSEAGPATRDFRGGRGWAGRAQNSGGHSPPDCAYCRPQTVGPLLPRQPHPHRRLRMRPAPPACPLRARQDLHPESRGSNVVNPSRARIVATQSRRPWLVWRGRPAPGAHSEPPVWVGSAGKQGRSCLRAALGTVRGTVPARVLRPPRRAHPNREVPRSGTGFAAPRGLGGPATPTKAGSRTRISPQWISPPHHAGAPTTTEEK